LIGIARPDQSRMVQERRRVVDVRSVRGGVVEWAIPH
jgi:hypothetical protein